jgi:hypothetical protein
MPKYRTELKVESHEGGRKASMVIVIDAPNANFAGHLIDDILDDRYLEIDRTMLEEISSNAPPQ